MQQKIITLSNGVEIPALGFGTWQIEEYPLAAVSVRAALQAGYRHIDTAAAYGNEEGVGRGIEESGVSRKDIFLTTKLWNTDQGYEATLRAFDKSLRKLQTDYVDLYLIHWPKGELSAESWKAFEKIYHEGMARAIGVCNFHEHHLELLLPHCEVRPMVNQIELHPLLTQEPLRAFCEKQDIRIEAWSPLMRGKLFDVPLLKKLADKYNRPVSQIVLRWDVQQGIITIPKSAHKKRIEENMQLFDFELSEEDMAQISSLNKGQRIGPNPDNFNF